jgi:hypothetical protein
MMDQINAIVLDAWETFKKNGARTATMHVTGVQPFGVLFVRRDEIPTVSSDDRIAFSVAKVRSVIIADDQTGNVICQKIWMRYRAAGSI